MTKIKTAEKNERTRRKRTNIFKKIFFFFFFFLMTRRETEVQFKMVFIRSEKSMYAQPHLSEVFPTLSLKEF